MRRANRQKEKKRMKPKNCWHEMDALIAKDDFEGLKKLIEDNKIKCAVSGTANWTDIRQFNLMFSTEFGSTASAEDEDNKVYCGRKRTGYICKFSECAENRADEDSFWYCTDR